MHKIDSKYFIDDLVQVMIPVSNNCAFFGPNGIQFYSVNGNILKNEYTENSKSNLFPFHDLPIHEDKYGIFSNQLFELEKQYLSIHTINSEYKFRSDYYFKKDGIIYSNSGEIIDFKTTKNEKISLDEFIQNLCNKNCDYFYIIDKHGKLHEFNQDIEDDLPYSGVIVSGNSETIEATIYKTHIHFGGKAFVERKNLKINNKEYLNIEGTHIDEPDIKPHIK